MTAATRRRTRPRQLVVAVVSAAFALGACGAGGGGSDGSDVVADAPTPSTSGGSTASEASPSTAATSAPGTQEDLPTTKSAPAATATAGSGDGGALGGDTGGSPLRRRDVPPEGVAAQLSPVLRDGPGICFSDASAPLSVTPISPTIAVGDSMLVCVSGSAAGTVSVHVGLPDGSVRPLAPPDSGGTTTLVVAVLDPLGTYDITAAQGAGSTTTSVEVTLPDQPVVEALGPSDAPPGTTFRFAVASPAPGETVALDLYRGVDYATTLPPARTDGSGRVVYELSTLADDPPGSYCIRARAQHACASFRLS